MLELFRCKRIWQTWYLDGEEDRIGGKTLYKRNYTDVNSKTWDKWAENGCEWSQPNYENILKQSMNVAFT